MKTKKYGNYELHPFKQIKGFEREAFSGTEDIENELKRHIDELLKTNKKVVISFETYVGVDISELKKLAEKLNPVKIIDTEDCAKSEEKLNAELNDYITNDRVFGVMCHKKLEDLFEPQKLEDAKAEIDKIKEGLIIVMGLGAGLVTEGDCYIYCPVTRWEIQLRYRAGMPNWHCTNNDAPALSKYKRGFFIEWRLADRFKRSRYNSFDYVLESEKKGEPKLITGKAFREGLTQLSHEPFRMEPYFDPGVWGGHWMQENFGLSREEENFAWSFDGVPEENSICLKYGDVKIKLPTMDLVQYQPKKLLGDRVHARFGAEFPIRFDLLDTVGGGNLSLQVHPLTEYIQDNFGMHYTQDESYYILDVDTDDDNNTDENSNPDAYVYLGVKSNVDKKQMEKDLKRAEAGEISFPAEDYVNKIPVKKHDHVLIPAGTVHCSGKDTMVLEISATPFIFTFKMWDWGRVGLDGLPRPIHIDHGLKNIQWDRDMSWIEENLIHMEEKLIEDDGVYVERTGLHSREFIETIRYTLTKSAVVKTEDSVHMMNLVDGESARIESIDGSFEPFEIHYAETAIVPASVKEYKIKPVNGEIKMIVASVRK